MIRVSVVVPALNEERLLPACLESLVNQDFEGDLEIIVVDNGSTDATGSIARAARARVVEEPQRGYAAALACGFRAATGSIIATTDADTVVPRNWISTIALEYAEHPDVVAVGGSVVFLRPNPLARILTNGVIPMLYRLDGRSRGGPHLWGANFSVLRSAFLEAGGWNPQFNLQSDTELSERLRSFGRVVRLENLSVYTSSRRWNRSLFQSSFLFASNFACFLAFRRPLWRGFPDIREDGSTEFGWRRLARSAAATCAIAVALFVGYETFTPWSNAFGTTYWEGGTGRKVVALTFDDGPDEPSTSKVLSILRQEGVHATFFLVGENVRRYPGVAATIVHDGHAIGNHSDSHKFGFALEPARLERIDLDRAEEAIHAATGEFPRLFRPPQGLRSPWLMALLKQDSLVTVTWDDAAGDWNPLTAKQIEDRTVAGAHPGAIILLHDGLHERQGTLRSATINSLPGIIHRLRAMGYDFVTLPELLQTSGVLHAGLPQVRRAVKSRV
jgi:peptidoglycan/xylan/chitin deacetylase (PgdA/CDA1 family)/GT2 family glycosyltransferase